MERASVLDCGGAAERSRRFRAHRCGRSIDAARTYLRRTKSGGKPRALQDLADFARCVERASVLDCGGAAQRSHRFRAHRCGRSTDAARTHLRRTEKPWQATRSPRPRGPRTVRGTRQRLGLRRRSAAEPPLSGAPVRTKHGRGPIAPPADGKRWQATRTPRPRGPRTVRGTRQRLGLRWRSAAEPPLSGAPVRTKHGRGPDAPPADEKAVASHAHSKTLRTSHGAWNAPASWTAAAQRSGATAFGRTGADEARTRPERTSGGRKAVASHAHSKTSRTSHGALDAFVRDHGYPAQQAGGRAARAPVLTPSCGSRRWCSPALWPAAPAVPTSATSSRGRCRDGAAWDRPAAAAGGRSSTSSQSP